MDDIGGLVEGAIEQLGRTFLIAGLIPVMVLVGLNQYVFFSGAVTVLGTESSELILGIFPTEILDTVLISLPLALILLNLNIYVIKLFEGEFPGAKVIFAVPYQRFLALHRKYYEEISQHRQQRRNLLTAYEMTGEYDEEGDDALQQAIDKLHRERESDHAVPRLPFDQKYVLPTAFGNAWASFEEYPRTRYGIDGMVFWPYLRTIVKEKNSDLLSQIDGQKFLLDVAMNMSLILGILFLESLVLGIMRLSVVLIVIAAICLLLYFAFYRAAVSYSRSIGVYTAQAYDLYRYDLLDAFDLVYPTDLDDEFWVWSRLAAFIRRGEPFYFNYLDRASEAEEGEDEA